MAKKRAAKKKTTRKPVKKAAPKKRAAAPKRKAAPTALPITPLSTASMRTAPAAGSSDKKTWAIVGLVVNVLLMPGLGTVIAGDTTTGVKQIILFLIGVLLSLVLIGIPLVIAAWIWALISSINQLQAA
jgi:TM2 domain-containing membrane protein YozV